MCVVLLRMKAEGIKSGKRPAVRGEPGGRCRGHSQTAPVKVGSAVAGGGYGGLAQTDMARDQATLIAVSKTRYSREKAQEASAAAKALADKQEKNPFLRFLRLFAAIPPSDWSHPSKRTEHGTRLGFEFWRGTKLN